KSSLPFDKLVVILIVKQITIPKLSSGVLVTNKLAQLLYHIRQ
ncbi:unnamed protein product, partial [Heterotrigona itama]